MEPHEQILGPRAKLGGEVNAALRQRLVGDPFRDRHLVVLVNVRLHEDPVPRLPHKVIELAPAELALRDRVMSGVALLTGDSGTRHRTQPATQLPDLIEPLARRQRSFLRTLRPLLPLHRRPGRPRGPRELAAAALHELPDPLRVRVEPLLSPHAAFFFRDGRLRLAARARFVDSRIASISFLSTPAGLRSELGVSWITNR